MMRKFNRGITLIALVVTIIVLLILAGISITMLTGQNGIINRAQEAKEKAETANDDEQRKLAQAEALMNTEITTYKGVNLPEGFAPTKIEGENSLDDGLVITDAKGNEFIWIEVPKTTSVYSTAGLNITDFTYDEYTKIETDLQTYTKDYRNGTTYNDVYYPDDTNGWFTETGDTSYDMAKKKMLKSVYQNGGFWVGRYEAGIEVARTASGDTTTLPLTKANLYPYIYVTRTQAKVLAEKVESGSYTSSLMFGVQWDLVLKYFETKNVTSKASLATNSATIGNYYDSEFTLNRGKFAEYGNSSKWFDYNSEEKSDLVTRSKKQAQISGTKGIMLTTGATNKAKLQNIYDIAGNVWEWTLEKTSSDSNPCAYRGGTYSDKGTEHPANSRFHDVTSYANGVIGFRVALY